MSRSNKRAADIGFAAISIEGGLIAPDQVLAIASAAPDAKMAAEYGCPKGTNLRDEITRYFNIAQAHWQAYARIDQPTMKQTADFVRDLLEQAFGFALTGPHRHEREDRRYLIAWEAKGGRVPVIVAPPAPADNGKPGDGFARALPEFGDGEGGRARRSPTVLLQDWLNANPDFYWGLVFAGDRVRLMRDNASLTRPAWIEADLGAILRDGMFADFSALWLLIHSSRFGAEGAPASDCALERWREAGTRAGTAARDRLRVNVEDALLALGQGLLDGNPALRSRLDSNELSLARLFEQMLRVVYRLIFLAVAEDRDLLHPRGTAKATRDLYASNYGFAWLRERSAKRSAHDHHHDAWEGLKVVFRALEQGQPALGLPALGGLFGRDLTPDLNDAQIPNRALLAAAFKLGWLIEDGRRVRINWRDMATEELGSVYEGLLELTPMREDTGRTFAFVGGAKGNARKTSGSYYTPDSLVQCLLDTALDPVLDKAEAEGGVEAILDLKVIDPACGSGHFLLGAARRMATRIAQIRNPDAPDYNEALRDVVSRCIHGVDRNPMAVELAKVALWIESVSPGQPLGFLDGNLRCGDALLGVFDLAALEEGIPDEAYKPLTGDDKDTAAGLRKLNKAEREAGLLRATYDPAALAGAFRKFHRMPENTPREVAARAAEFERIRQSPEWQTLHQACDIFVSAFLLPKPKLSGIHEKALVPTTAQLRKVLSGSTGLGIAAVQGELEAAIHSAADAARAFHWPLEFPDVLVGKGGFDVVLGNPPWERIKLQEDEFFAGSAIAETPNAAARTQMIKEWGAKASGTWERSLVDAFDLAKRFAKASALFFTAPKDSDPIKISLAKVKKARRFPWTGRGDVNTYALFAEHFLNLTREGGRSGVIVPTGIATDATTAPFFAHLVHERLLASYFSFYEVRKWFVDTDDRRDFCLLTTGAGVSEAKFASLLTSIGQLADNRLCFTQSPADIARLNPNTKTAPIFRSRRDAELTANIYARVPVLIEKGKPTGNPWQLSFMAMFHMSNDSPLFRTAAELAAGGFSRIGSDWIRECAPPSTNPSQLDAIAASVEEIPDLLESLSTHSASVEPVFEKLERYVPLFEAKMLHQYDHRFGDGARLDARPQNTGWPKPSDSELVSHTFEASPWYWVPESEAESRYRDQNWSRPWTINWRRSARAGDERTLIASALPATGIGDNLFTALVRLEGFLPIAFWASWNTLVVDYCLRQKAGGANMNYFIIEQLPILPPQAYDEAALAFIVPRVLELTYTSHSMAPFARDLGYDGPPFTWDEERRAQLRAELDAWYALAYGLSRDELRYVLDPKDVMGEDYPSETFRVLQKNEIAKYGEYRTRRLVLAAYDALVAQGMRPRTEGWR